MAKVRLGVFLFLLFILDFAKLESMEIVNLRDQIQPHAQQAAALLKAIAHEERLLILCALAQGEKSAGDLWQQSTLSQSAFSQHLAVLRKEQLVTVRKEAQTVFYSLDHPIVLQLLRVLRQSLC